MKLDVLPKKAGCSTQGKAGRIYPVSGWTYYPQVGTCFPKCKIKGNKNERRCGKRVDLDIKEGIYTRRIFQGVKNRLPRQQRRTHYDEREKTNDTRNSQKEE